MDKGNVKLNSMGYAIEDVPPQKSVARRTYWTKEGREIPNLPADAYHMERYLKRGFTLTEPQAIKEVK